MSSTTVKPQVKLLPILTAIFFGSFVSTLATSTMNIAIPVLQHDFNTTLGTIQWVLTGFMLAMGTVAPVTGYFGERFSYKRLYLFALIGFTLASVLCAVVTTAPMLIAFRIVQGMFSGLIVPATMAIIFQVIPKEKQPIAMSIWAASSMLAPAVGPTFAGWLLEHLSWHWLFWINVPIGIVSILLVFPFIPYYRLQVPKSFDLIGFITVIISSSTLLVALSQGNAWGWTSGKTLSLFIAGFVFLALFVWRELTAETPLLNLRVFGNARYSITLILTSIITISLYSGMLLTPVFLQNIQRVTPMDTGLILLPSSLAMAIITLFVGKLYTVIGPRVLMLVGIVVMAAGTLPLSWLSVNISHEYILLCMVVRNIGIALTMMPASNAGMEQIPPQLSGHASSISNWLRNVFGSFAIAIFTSLLTSRTTAHFKDLAAAGDTDKTHMQMMSFTMSVNDVYLVATVIVLAALPFAYFIRKNRAKPAQAAGQKLETKLA